MLGVGSALLNAVLVPLVDEDPEVTGGLPVDVLVVSQAVLASVVGLTYATAWARTILGRGVEDLEADFHRDTRGSARLPRVRRPWRLLLLGYVVPTLLALVALAAQGEGENGLVATISTVIGHVLVLLTAVGAGTLVMLPLVGLGRLLLGGGLVRHRGLVALLAMLLLIVPWGVLVTWSADSPYRGRRNPDWLLVLGIQRDGVAVHHPVALHTMQVMTYVIVGLLAYAVVRRKRQKAQKTRDATERDPLSRGTGAR